MCKDLSPKLKKMHECQEETEKHRHAQMDTACIINIREDTGGINGVLLRIKWFEILSANGHTAHGIE